MVVDWDQIGTLSNTVGGYDIRTDPLWLLVITAKQGHEGRLMRCIFRQQPLQHRRHHSSRPRLGSGRKRGTHLRALGRSRGGFTNKLHCLAMPSDDRSPST